MNCKGGGSPARAHKKEEGKRRPPQDPGCSAAARGRAGPLARSQKKKAAAAAAGTAAALQCAAGPTQCASKRSITKLSPLQEQQQRCSARQRGKGAAASIGTASALMRACFTMFGDSHLMLVQSCGHTRMRRLGVLSSCAYPFFASCRRRLSSRPQHRPQHPQTLSPSYRNPPDPYCTLPQRPPCRACPSQGASPASRGTVKYYWRKQEINNKMLAAAGTAAALCRAGPMRKLKINNKMLAAAGPR